MSDASTSIEVFCCYSHADESWLRKLEIHLSLLKRQGLISLWHDRLIPPGTDWTQAIDTHLETASVILLLVSADFLASDYCYSVEMQRALARHAANEVRVVPILVRPVDWTDAPFAHLQALPTDAKPIASWRSKERALVDVAAGIRRVIEDVPLLAASTPRTALPTTWNIPYRRNPFFTGREVVLQQLHDYFTLAQASALTQSQAITGLGGVGKTQIAVEYAYRCKDEYRFVFWANATTQITLGEDFVKIARALQLLEKDEPDQALVVEAVKQWFSSHGRWLLILDNADDLPTIASILPSTTTGHLLLTSRRADTGAIAESIEVGKMNQVESSALLLQRAKIVASHLKSTEEQAIMILLSELDGLPLALDQAGAYIEEMNCLPSRYLKAYQQRQESLLHHRDELNMQYPSSVATTWSLNFEQIEHRDERAADLLRFLAFLAPDAIPEDLIIEGASKLGSHLQDFSNDETLLDEAIGTLRRFSLVQRQTRNHFLYIHRLVQVVLKMTMTDEIQHQWAERTIRAMNQSFPQIEVDTWSQCERYLPHTLVCASLVETYSLMFPEAAHLLNRTALYLYKHAQYSEAEPLYRQALTIWEQVLGPTHPDTALGFNNLAALYQDQGKYEQAEPLYQRALAIWEQVLGPTHPDTAIGLNNLAVLYDEQGKYEQSEPLYQRALAIREQVFGPTHPNIAACLNNLALLYKAQGKYEQAEPLLQRALIIWEQVLGPTHPDTASCLNNLATFYDEQGKYEQSEPLHQRALAIREQVLGPTHPATALSLNNLAGLYESQGKYEQAEPLYQRALSIYEQVLGPTHPDTATCLSNLTALYKGQGKYEQAEPLLQRALAIRKQVLGPSHPDTAQSLNNLALLYESQGKHDQAEPLYQRALAIWEQVLGPTHADIATCLSNLTAIYYKQGKYEQAEPLLQRALAIRKQVLGPTHPDTAESLNDLSALYYNQGKYEQSEPLLQQALAIWEQVLGPTHGHTKIARDNYADLLREMHQRYD